MNIVELREMMTSFKGSIWWNYKGLEVCISYDKSDSHSIPLLLINGKVIGSTGAALFSKNYLIENLDHIFSETECKQIKYLLHPLSIYEPFIDEDTRFLQEELTERAEFILCRTTLNL